MTSQQLQEFAQFADKLADAAREVILPYWRKPIEVESKIEGNRPVDESPVTIADRQAEMAMRRLIEEHYPEHGIYGEEYGNVRTTSEWVWVLDPIDGTKSFITGKPLFGTLIGLMRNGTPMVGVIDQCVLDERWVGIVGQDTRLNGKVVKTCGCGFLCESMMYATTPHMFAPGLEQVRYKLISDAVKRPLYGADCYAYALVASGFGADLVVEADLGLYDYCAAVPIVQAAGGFMSDWSGNALTLANHEASKSGTMRVVAAANKGLHAEALVILSGGRDMSTSAKVADGAPDLPRSTPCTATTFITLAIGIALGSMLARKL